ncbi:MULTISPECIES: porin family protein [Rufibacter]|uniref:porin family protein n=1 Tax=Rufibacter TaxID=1379908 RepID=UPI001B30F2BA|nr:MULTISPECIES: porin family protein [Rufibacter]
MKKLLFFIAALFTTYFAQAQEGIKLGIKAGGNFTNVMGDDLDDAEYIFGFHGGLFADYGISEMVSIRPELLYSLKGFKFEGEEDGEEVTLKSRLSYIDVPILAHINAGGLFFELGPTLGFMVNDKNTLEIDGEEIDLDTEEGEGYKKFEFGYAAGIGYQMPAGLGIGLRYQGGITSINEDDDIKVRNSVFQLSLSYMFGGR